MSRKPHLAKQIWTTLVGATVSVSVAQELVEVKEGDVISAEVINGLISGLNQVQNGFQSVDDLDGTWSCTVYDTGAAFGVETCSDDGALVRSKTGDLTFDSSNKTWNWAGPGSLNDCGSGLESTGSFDVKAGRLLTNIGVYPTFRISLNSFVWDVTNSFPPSGFNLCTKVTAPPNAVNNLVATDAAAGIKLTWTDQSTNESGFRVERKAATVSSAWATLQSLGVDVVSFTDTSPANGETWQYRVFAFNDYGDAYTSSVVQHTFITSN